jgi:hypothetical protein
MIKITKLFILCLFAMPVFPQSIGTLYESLSVNDRFSNMMNLQHYQAANPEHAVVYYLLAGIYDEYMRETNPITMFDFLETNYRHIDTYLGLVNGKLDEKQARQDREYYGNIPIISDQRKVGIEDILHEVDQRLKAAQEYFNHAKKVHDSYVIFANSYNACLFRYRDISAAFSNYKTLYMLTGKSLRADIEKIKSEFESALLNFNAYQEACAQLPHILRVNTYTLHVISTYRLEGLVESDFTLPVVDLWDFGTWASDFLRILDTDIATIRNGLSNVHLAFIQQHDKFKNENIFYENPPFYRPEVKFQNLIAKYDHQSLANDYIDYQNNKIQFLRNTRLTINDVNDPSAFFLINKLRFYQNLAMQKQALNAQADQLRKRIHLSEVEKYIDFFDQHFNGMDGFSRWCVVEQYDNDRIFDQNLNKLDSFIHRQLLENNFKGTYLVFQKRHIPLGITTPNDSLIDASLTIQKMLINRKGHTFLLGTDSTKSSNNNVFIVKADRENNVEWMVYLENAQTLPCLALDVQQAELLDNGELMLAGTMQTLDADSILNYDVFTLVYDESGNEKRFQLIPRYQQVECMLVDEIAEQYMLLTHQLELDNNVASGVSVGLYNFNDSLLWEQKLRLDGDLVNVLVSNADFYLICNYRFLSVGNKKLETKNGKRSLASIYLDRSGKNMLLHEYQSGGEMFVEHAYKLTNNVFNYLGETEKNTSGGKQFYLLVDEQGRPILSNSPQLNYQRFEP